MEEPSQRRSVRSSLPPGTRVGRYTIVDRIGAGGMAELFLARQDGPRGFAKPIALKLLHPHIAEDPEFVAMFEREARVAAALVHPNVAQVLDVGVAEGDHFLALEFVHGRDVRRILAARRGPLPLGCAVRIVAEVAKALQYVHTRCDSQGRPLDLVHRDVSPANVLVGFAGSVKLADFGIAKAANQTAHTRTGTLKGKFGYMAPEQYLQQAVDPRADLFALGVVLYEASTGRRAFAGTQTFSIMNRVLAGDYAPPRSLVPDYPGALEDLVARLLAVDPSARPNSAQAVADELEAFVLDTGIDARADTLGAIVSELFDCPNEPSLDTPELAPPSSSMATATIPGEPTAIRTSVHRRSRLPRIAALATIGVVGIVVGGVGGWRMARGDESATEVEPETVVAAPVRVEAAEPPSPVTTPVVVPAVAKPVVAPASDAPRSRTKPHRRTAAHRRDRAARATGEPGDLTEMFPKAMQ